jgi:hypothetical protein
MVLTRRKIIIVAFISLILLVVFVVAWFGEKEVDQDGNGVVPYDPSQIPEDMLTPVYYTVAFTEWEKAELEAQGFDCDEWDTLGPGGGYEDGVHWIGPAVDRRWLCDKEMEELNGNVIVILVENDSFDGMEKGLDGRRLLSESVKEYPVVITQTGRLEWFYGYQMEKGNFVDFAAQGFCHEYHYSPLKVYSSRGECYEGHKGSLVVTKGETITFEVFRQVYSIRDCENEEILDWGGLTQNYWLSVKLYPVLEEV